MQRRRQPWQSGGGQRAGRTEPRLDHEGAIVSTRRNVNRYGRAKRMTVENNLLRPRSFVVKHERHCRVPIRIKAGFICGNSVTAAKTTIIENQNVESVFRKSLAHPAN